MRQLFTLCIGVLFFLSGAMAQPIIQFDTLMYTGPRLVNPVDITGAGDGSGRLFFVEKRGTIRIMENNVVLNTFFLDIQSQVMNSGERGLLGMAFHPQYPDSPYVYVNYVVTGTITTRISRFTLNSTNDLLESSQLILITQPGVQTNHKAGDLCFGPDGYLYIGMGDGGGGFDPDNNGQDLTTLLGKILRIDVNSKTPPLNYSIPPDNPFADAGPEKDEIWAFGIRNPWRISFDRTYGNFWIADVGQNEWEEIDWVAAGTPGGMNFGWDCQEGNHPLETQNCDGNTVYTWPIFEYPHNCNPCPVGKGASLTGGFVYRGSESPLMNGYYICADYVSNYYWLTHQTGHNPPTFVTYYKNGSGVINAIVSFGEDDNGEIYACNLNGRVYAISSNSALPVNWEAIDAVHIDKGNRVSWTLHQTFGIDHFEVQRSVKKEFDEFVSVADVLPVTDQIHYAYTDNFNQYEGAYYRIAAHLTDGSIEFSPIARILPDPKSKPVLVFDHGLHLWRLSLPEQWQSGFIAIYDLQGKEVFTQKLVQDEMIEVTPTQVPGCYFIQVNADNGTWSDRMIW